MRKEWRVFLTTVMFYTRIPCPAIKDFKPSLINQATRYFPVIGWMVGLISFGVFVLCRQLFDAPALAVALSMLAGVLVTGGFHEDGLADVFDGFGGGWTKGKILEIMKDSRVGAYGVISLVFLFIIKVLALTKMVEITSDRWLLGLVFVNYHTLARLTSISLVFVSTYAREDLLSKAKPISQTKTATEVVLATLTGLLPLALLAMHSWVFLFVFVPLSLLLLISKKYFEKWIGGYTGDCLGAAEQIGEVVCLLSFIVLWKFI